MISEERLQELESKIAHLEAVIDGSEAQTREATAYVVSIFARFLHEKGLIDERALRDYVATFEGEASDDEDYMGDLVRLVGDMIDFQRRHPNALDLSSHGLRGRPATA